MPPPIKMSDKWYRIGSLDDLRDQNVAKRIRPATCRKCGASITYRPDDGKWIPYDTGTDTPHFDTCNAR